MPFKMKELPEQPEKQHYTKRFICSPDLGTTLENILDATDHLDDLSKVLFMTDRYDNENYFYWLEFESDESFQKKLDKYEQDIDKYKLWRNKHISEIEKFEQEQKDKQLKKEYDSKQREKKRLIKELERIQKKLEEEHK